MIGILDYGMSNLASVSYAFKRVGAQARIIRTTQDLQKCEALVIPGVGSFMPAMKRLAKLKPGIVEFAERGKPLLGICLGMQVLFEQGTEEGVSEGLGLLKGKVEKMFFAPKLPHVGWNQVAQAKDSKLFKGVENGAFFYFVHSYACWPLRKQDIAGLTEYRENFVSAVEKKNVFGVQFHPEKSSSAGESLLRNFARMV